MKIGYFHWENLEFSGFLSVHFHWENSPIPFIHSTFSGYKCIFPNEKQNPDRASFKGILLQFLV